ncbi:MAG: GDP-mannose 4,6-dehydratase [Acidimicrobiia bacterium]|nr:GDP-mannose 4,6-dehydratase [Acidimicrobiia bacterium]NNL27290.1 NAD-dependent epimerase/dehydratase family protein [Acidimicrobiia bacterium]
MTTSLVTGGAGFIGSHLSDRLVAEGHDVVIVDNLSKGRIERLHGALGAGATLVDLDITSDEIADLFSDFKPDLLFHLAAQSAVRPSVDDPVFDATVNVVGTVNLLEAARKVGTQRIVFASSGGAIYGEVTDPATELQPKHPDSPYGISKKIVEDYFRFYLDQYGLDYMAMALGNVYGPRQDPHGEAGVIAIFARLMLDGKTPTINGDGSQQRDYVYVADVVDAFVRAGDIGGGRLLNIGTGDATSVSELYAALANTIGFDGDPIHGPSKAGDLARSVIDASAARQHLGWNPGESLESGLDKTVAWFREFA